MRFLHYRQLLRGLIAASLAIAGTSADVASAGIQSTRWSQICLLNDREYDPWDASNTYEPLGCVLAGAAAESELDDCIQANSFHIDRQVALSLLHHHLPKFHCSSWIHGFRTTGQGLGDWLGQQFDLGRASRGHLVELALTLGRSNDSSTIDTAEGVADAGYPVREMDGNLFVYVFHEETDAISNFDSCFAEAVGGRPPVLESDQQAFLSSEIAATTKDGIGHCSVPSSEAFAPPDTQGDSAAFASQESDLSENTLFQEWVSPDWNIQHWEIHTYAPRYEYKLEGFAAKPIFPPEGLFLDLAQQSAIPPEVEQESLATIASATEGLTNEGLSTEEGLINEGLTNEALTNEGLTNEGLTNEGLTNEGLTNEGLTNEGFSTEEILTEVAAQSEPNDLDAWFSTAWDSMLQGVERRWSELEPAAEELSAQSARILSRKLKYLGMMLIQSADRLDRVSLPIGIAGRSGTQR